MRTYLGLAAVSVFAVEVSANMSRHKEAYLEQVKGVNMDVLKGSVGWATSKAAKKTFHLERQSAKKMEAHRLQSVFASDEQDEAFKNYIGNLATTIGGEEL